MVPAAIIVLVVFALLVGWNIKLKIENSVLKQSKNPTTDSTTK